MSTPAVTISKNTFSTAQAPASTTGILAIVAASSTGTNNVPGGYSRTDLAVNDKGYGPLTDYAAYTIATANEPVVLVKGNAGFAPSIGTITKSLGTGTSTVTDNASAPYDTYNVQINIVAGGTRGTAGITYTYSLDGGNTVSGAQALGTATTLTIPNTGVSFSIGAGTVAAGASWQAYTTRPMLNDTDITNAMTGLGNTRLPFEGVLIDTSAGAGTVGVVDTILSGWEGRGIFKFALINSRYKNEPVPATEDEPTYLAALTALFGAQTSIRMCAGADGGHSASPITGWNLMRPTAMFLAARAMSTQIGEDPAFVGRGAVPNCQIADSNGNPANHDEDLYPGIDAIRLTSLRSFAPGGPQGAYITNGNTLAPTGSPIAYLQHIRTLNRACEIAWAILTRNLSRGVRKNLQADKVTGAVYILEADAQQIEGQVNDALYQALKGQVNAFHFSVSRTDDLNAIPAVVNALVEIQAYAYIKSFRVQAQFSKTITSAL
jgi:hypothetical protein